MQITVIILCGNYYFPISVNQTIFKVCGSNLLSRESGEFWTNDLIVTTCQHYDTHTHTHKVNFKCKVILCRNQVQSPETYAFFHTSPFLIPVSCETLVLTNGDTVCNINTLTWDWHAKAKTLEMHHTCHIAHRFAHFSLEIFHSHDQKKLQHWGKKKKKKATMKGFNAHM